MAAVPVSVATTHILIAYAPDTTAKEGHWLQALIEREFPTCRTTLVASPERHFLQAIVGSVGERPDSAVQLIVITVFYDGLSDDAKAVFLPLKGWAAGFPHVVLQALNAKKGQHSFFENPSAVTSSIAKRIQAPPAQTAAAAASGTAAAPNGKDAAAAAVAAAGTPVEHQRDEMTTAHLQSRIAAGQGEAIWTILAADAAGLPAQEAQLRSLAIQNQCGVFPAVPPRRVEIAAPLSMTTTAVSAPPSSVEKGAGAAAPPLAGAVGNSSSGAANVTVTTSPSSTTISTTITPAATVSAASVSAAASASTCWQQEFVVRRRIAHRHMELRLAMCGNVDSGKSTLTSVLTKGYRDDGRGFARAKVFNHRHEQETGRTSSISEQHLAFDAEGGVINYPPGGPTSAYHQFTAQDLSEKAAKVLTLFDLAGHEKYLKTTVLGMTRNLPDYACIVISANNGIQRMTKEHLGLCLALHLPFFIVVTRIDATPDNVRMETLATINKLLKVPTVKKLPFPVRNEEDVLVSAKNLKADRITPIFEVSNVSGIGIAALLHFLNLLPVRRDWAQLASLPKEMIIDNTFFVTGVGTVVGGIVTQGVFRPNDAVLLGPDALGNFRTTQIKSIHVKGVEVDEVTCGQDAAMCLKKEKRNAIRKGNVLVDPSSAPKAHWMFEAEVKILYHSTTISIDYEPVIHTHTVRQSARIVHIDQQVLRTGDHAICRFHFLYRPEFIRVGQRLIFREGRTKGIGTICKLLDGTSDTITNSARSKLKAAVREKHAATVAGGGAAAPPSATTGPGGGGGAKHVDPSQEEA